MFNILGTIGDIIRESASNITRGFGGEPSPKETVQNITSNLTPQVTPVVRQTPTQVVQKTVKNVKPQITKAPVVQSYGLNEILRGQPTYNQSVVSPQPQNQTVVPQAELNRARIDNSRVTERLSTPDHYINTYFPEFAVSPTTDRDFKIDKNAPMIDLSKTKSRVNEFLNFLDVGAVTAKDAVDSFSSRFVDMLDNFDANNPQPISKKAGSLLNTATGAAGLIPSWLAFSMVLNGVKKDSSQGEAVAKAIEWPIEKISELGAMGAGKFVDVLPIPQSAKDNIKGPLEELSSLMAIIIAGHATPVVLKRANELRKTIQEKTIATYKSTNPQGGYISFGKTIENNIDKLPPELRDRIEANAYREEAFKDNPLNKLTKYESKNKPGELPEFTGTKDGGKFKQVGDQLIAELIPESFSGKNLPDTKDLAEMYSNFISSKRAFEAEQKALKKEALDYLNSIKTTPSKVSVNKLSSTLENSLEKNTSGIRDKSLEYYRANPSKITESPVRLREVDGKIIIEDGRHRLEAARELGIKNIKIEDVTPQYPVKEGQVGSPSKMIESLLSKTPETFTIGDAIKNPTRFTIKEPTYVPPKVNLKKTREFAEGQPKPKVVAKESTLLKDRIRAESGAARDAAVATRIEMRKSFSDKTKSVADIKKTMVDYIKKELPTNARGTYLQRVAELDTPTKFNKVFDQVTEQINKYNKLQAQSKTLGSLRSKQAFLTKIGEFANVTIRDIKKQLGLEGVPIRKMTEPQLNAMIAESKVRLDFKIEKNMLEGESKPKTETSESEYAAIAEKYNKMTLAQRVKKNIKDKKDAAKKVISSTTRRNLQPISTVLENIDKKLAYKFQKSKRQTLENIAKRQEGISKFADTYSKSKMSAGDKRVYKKAWVDNDIKKLDELNKKYNVEGFDKLRETYDEIIEDINSISTESSKVNRRDDYFNRVVTNSDALAEWLVDNADVDFNKTGYLGQKYRERAAKLGRELTKQEQSKLLSGILMNGNMDVVSMAKNGNFKKRLIDKIPDELLDYYADPVDALKIYIQKATEEIEMRKMFLGEKMESAGDFDIPVSDLILGNGLAEVAGGKLSLDKLKRLQEVVKAYYGEHGSPNGVNQFLNKATTIAVMNNPLSAIKNLGDIFTQMVEEGVPSVLQAAGRKMKGKTELDLVKMGIDEGPSMDITGKSVVKDLYKYIGFTAVEGFNKSIGMESTVIKARKQANKIKDVNEFVDKYGDLSKYEPMIFNDLMNKLVTTFGDNPKLIKDAIKELQSGKVGDLTKDIAFKRTGDRTILTNLDKPINYSENPNARILYHLKTYQIKLFNNQINKGWKLLGSTNPKTRALGATYLVRTAMIGTLFNASINTVIDMLLGKEIDISDELFAGFLQTLVPINKYGLGTIATKGVWEFMKDTIAPPLSWTNNVGKDIGGIYQSLTGEKEWEGFSKLKSIQNVPFVGKQYYNWFGAGADKNNKDTKAKNEKILKDLGIDIPSSKPKKQSNEQILKDLGIGI